MLRALLAPVRLPGEPGEKSRLGTLLAGNASDKGSGGVRGASDVFPAVSEAPFEVAGVGSDAPDEYCDSSCADFCESGPCFGVPLRLLANARVAYAPDVLAIAGAR